MENFQELLNKISGFIWGEYLLIPLLALVGIYLTIGLRALTWRFIPYAFVQLWRGRTPENQQGDISSFQALMTALSATIGTGNIAGVATAIHFGGPGAVFWMWMIALFGMATKYAEGVLAVKYRETDELGKQIGGPMYYIKNGLSSNWHWLGYLFAVFGMFAAFGIGNMVQSHSVADEMQNSLNLPTWFSGVILTILSGAVILGGITRIGKVAESLVPFMASAYVLGALTIIVLHIDQLPSALGLILSDAFTGNAAGGGAAGAGIWLAIRWGVARGIFSNESGLGSAPIAHAAAKTNDPVQQGMIAMLGTFIDTIIVCSMTALVIIMTGAWQSDLPGVPMSSMAYSTGINGGGYIVTFGIIVFAFTTILGWSYYGERCAEFLFGIKIIQPYRIAWVLAVFAGSMFKLEMVWTIADVLNGLMALPNLIALLLLGPVIFKITREYLIQHKL